MELLPPTAAVVEILEDVRAEPEILAACRALKTAGFKIALDDVVDVADVDPFLEIADFLKVDFRSSTRPQRQKLATRFSSVKPILLAEKVENEAEYQQARDMGFQLFQGFFFQKPSTLRAHDVPALKVNYVRLLAALQRPSLDLQEVEGIIKAELSLSYRLLRYLNSPLFAFYTRIQSIKHALALLGETEVKRWLSIASLVSVGDDKPSEFVVFALVRARFCELLGQNLGLASGAFLLGLVSSLSFLLAVPME